MDFLFWSQAAYLSPDSYWSQNGGAPWSLSIARGEFRFEVRSGDHWPPDPVGSDKERSEIADRHTLVLGHTYRIRYQFQVEPGRPSSADWLVLGQIHQSDIPGAPQLSPPFEVDLNHEKMAVVVRWASGPLGVDNGPAGSTLWSDSSAIRRGRWYDMAIDVRFDPYGDGALYIRRDGIRLASYRGPLGFADHAGLYWKEGVYRAAAPETIAARFRNLSIVDVGPPGGAPGGQN
jgi:hypothetical protein